MIEKPRVLAVSSCGRDAGGSSSACLMVSRSIRPANLVATLVSLNSVYLLFFDPTFSGTT